MPFKLIASIAREELAAVKAKRLEAVIRRVAKRASSSAARKMMPAANKMVRAKKRLSLAVVKRSLVKPIIKSSEDGSSTITFGIRGGIMGAAKYKPGKQLKKGVKISVNKGEGRTLIEGAFLATMGKGNHLGIWKRDGTGKSGKGIKELFRSRVIDVFRGNEAEDVAEVGRAEYSKTFERLFALEMSKKRKARKRK